MTKIETNTFQELKQLKSLNLFYNQINCIETSAFAGLDNLETLNLGNNKLIKIDAYFQGLKQLKLLELDANSISCIASSAFVGPDNLETLNLSFKFTIFEKILNFVMDPLPGLKQLIALRLEWHMY